VMSTVNNPITDSAPPEEQLKPFIWSDDLDAAYPSQATVNKQLAEQFDNIAIGSDVPNTITTAINPPSAIKAWQSGLPKVKVHTNRGPKSGKKNGKNKTKNVGLSKGQLKMHRDYQNQAAQDSDILRGFFGDNQSTTGVTELRFCLFDWLERKLGPATAGLPIFSYYLDVGRPFFADASSLAGEQFTRSKVRRVKLWYLTPPEALKNAANNDIPLLQVLTAIPVKDESTANSLSLLGQSNTIIHPDVRQPWVMVGNWNWESIFENSQYQPFEFSAPSITDSRDFLALFTFLVIDATSGKPFDADSKALCNLKLEVELQAPIPLVPTPYRLGGISADFTTPPGQNDVSLDETPVQYSLKSIHKQM